MLFVHIATRFWQVLRINSTKYFSNTLFYGTLLYGKVQRVSAADFQIKSVTPFSPDVIFSNGGSRRVYVVAILQTGNKPG